jgi:hypothetical protein
LGEWVVKDTTFRREAENIPVLTVPRQCPLVLLEGLLRDCKAFFVGRGKRLLSRGVDCIRSEGLQVVQVLVCLATLERNYDLILG